MADPGGGSSAGDAGFFHRRRTAGALPAVFGRERAAYDIFSPDVVWTLILNPSFIFLS